MPNYIRRGGLDVQPPPWQCDDSDVTIFLMEADGNALQELCDRCLNSPGAGRSLNYMPVPNPISLGYEVALTFQHFKRLFSSSPNCEQQGVFSYWEASFWVIVQNQGEGSQGQVEVLLPYIFIDNWLPLAGGREIYGFPKEGATINTPETNKDPSVYTVEAPAIATYGANAPVAAARIIECRDLGTRTDDTLASRPLLQNLLGLGNLNFVFLREFRATRGGALVDLQQVVQASATPFTVSSPTVSPYSTQITLAQVASHPIAQDLGIPVNARGQIDAPLKVQCRAKFTMQEGVAIAP